MNLTIKDILNICMSTLFCGNENTTINEFSKDTRTLKEGDTYIGIKGASFDGNSLYKEAFSKGANCCVLEKNSFIKDDNYTYDKPIILVDNALTFLKEMATYKRNTSNATFIAVTGSVGKTSTRDMIYMGLKNDRKTLKTEGNFNNNIGLPLTIMRLKDEECAVIEMGMNNLGEISYLSKITKPHIAVITNVGTAHIGNLGSRENILKAKLEITDGLVPNGKLIINNDNDLLHEYYLNKENNNIITIGIDNESDYTAKDITITENEAKFKIIYNDKEYTAICPIPSKEFIYNYLVAFAVGTILNIKEENIIQNLKNLELTKNRLEKIVTKNNITIINDCYNASLDSMKASIKLLSDYKSQRKIAVLGSMLELGKFSKELHEEVGKFIEENKIDILLTVGKEAKYISQSAIKNGMNKDNVYINQTNKEAINKLKELIRKDDCILVKASNGLKFIEIVNALKK